MIQHCFPKGSLQDNGGVGELDLIPGSGGSHFAFLRIVLQVLQVRRVYYHTFEKL